MYLSIHLSIYLPIYVSLYPFIDLSICLSIYLCIYLPIDIYLSIHPSIHLAVYLSLSLSLVLLILFILDKVHNSLRLPRETTSEPPKVPRTCGALYIFTSTCASRHNGVHFFHIGTSQKWREHVVACTFSLRNMLRATTACTFPTSELPKVVRTWCVFVHVHFEMCFAPQRRQFFDISTSKSGLTMVCIVHFDFEMCFAPQRRALFRHLNFQKWSDTEWLCAFSLRNVLRATTACTFSTSQLPKVLRDPGGLYMLTCKCASRHNGVQFFISHLASWLRTRRFSEPTFRPSGTQNHRKNTVFRDFPTFSRICIFFLLTLSLLLFFLLIFHFSLPLPCSAFHLSILSEV